MVRTIGTCGVLLVVVCSPIATHTQRESLDNATIETALEVGRQGHQAPYTLHMTKGGSGVAGAVYTPFVRIAMLSTAARLQGRRLTAADLPDEVTKPITYIAVRWYCLDGDCSLPEATVPVGVRLTPEAPCYCAPSLAPPGAILPLWVTRNVGVLEAFGAEPPELAVVVAAFSLSSIKPGYWVSACAGTSPTQCDSSRAAPITSTDLARWR
jgi:hypothetical protein